MEGKREYIVKFGGDRMRYGKVELECIPAEGILRGVTGVVGKNGSGKTALGNVIAKGRYGYGNRLDYSEGISRIKMLAFTDIHSFTGIDVQYYQQRMEATANEYVLTVGEIFSKKLQQQEWREYCELFRLRDIEAKKINYLSSGEMRKLLIINALCERPDLLILDNPYIGVDAESRKDFDEALRLLRGEGLSVIMLLCDMQDVPAYVDSLIEMEDCRIGRPIAVGGDSGADARAVRPYRNDDIRVEEIPKRLRTSMYGDCDVVFSIKDGHARYGDKTIFEDFNWTVRRGECWALKGPNGSGKSLLLSMICADNPQGYSNDIILFDRKRGSGESIWDIKDAIGYICPEMQLYFKSNDSVREIIVQGMRNSLTRYRKSTEEELAVADAWMEVLEISHLSERKFLALSSGEQRMVLLARTFAKQPELLVLDEPLHGLDDHYKQLVKDVISRMVEENGSTLIFVTHYDSELPGCVKHFKDIIDRSTVERFRQEYSRTM